MRYISQDEDNEAFCFVTSQYGLIRELSDITALFGIFAKQFCIIAKQAVKSDETFSTF